MWVNAISMDVRKNTYAQHVSTINIYGRARAWWQESSSIIPMHGRTLAVRVTLILNHR